MPGSDHDQRLGRGLSQGVIFGVGTVRLWWRRASADTIDHAEIMSRIKADSGWTPRYAFMTLMSAGIAVLGLLLSSPAVVIGAMLISPLMNPILGFGFALATFDLAEARRSFMALAVGTCLAVAFTATIVVLSPLKEATAEILSRTRPNLFDLLVALFAALAGAFAIIKGGSGTIVGVAIATALMPPLAVVGYGLATWNPPVLVGSLALFGTNFVTIALAATIMARLYGFGRALSPHQTWIQSVLLILVFIVLAVPLALSLGRIGAEAVTVSEVRAFLGGEFGSASRITQLAVDFDAKPLVVRAVVIAPSARSKSHAVLQTALARRLGKPVTLQLDQVALAGAANTLEAQRTQLQASSNVETAARAEGDRVAKAVATAAGISPEEVIVDADHRRAAGSAVPLAGANLDTYRALEQRVADSEPDWRITLIPPFAALPEIRFARGSDALDDAARRAILTSTWAAIRWNTPALGVPGLPTAGALRRPSLDQRRAMAIAAILQAQGLSALPLRAAGPTFRLSLEAQSGAGANPQGQSADQPSPPTTRGSAFRLKSKALINQGIVSP